ncbi:N-acetyltransferase [Aeromicrobium phragmitis]|uniref:N-acetyltransferase n=1 Tax=Aeromicrobium phragmitis TaxID=2478914 RepID=A0A3L8PME6_9ACTN|nr:GNAT family N-acetyltransferase [Aeromicrobium phragmitis]RLV56557.1 N-acetyltransferase [Aeromicrobium phragmitis]
MTVWREVEFDDGAAVALRSQLSAEMNELYGRPGDAPEPDAGIDPESVLVTIVGEDAGRPVAAASLRRLGADIELKRMYVVPAARGRGLASELLRELEARAKAFGAHRHHARPRRAVSEHAHRGPSCVVTHRHHARPRRAVS